MQAYLVRRAGIAANAAELDAALTRLRTAEHRQAVPGAQWLRSYAVREPDGRLGLACVFLADRRDRLLAHAQQVQLAATEVNAIVQRLPGRAFERTHAVLVRRRACWPAGAATAVALPERVPRGEAAHGVRRLHSYVVLEADGTRGTWCLYAGGDVAAVRGHAAATGWPLDTAVPVLGRIVFRDEPPARPSSGPTRPDPLNPFAGDHP